MDFPSLQDFNKENNETKRKHLDILMISGDTNEFDSNLLSWKLIELTPTLMKIEIVFERPLEVSQGERPDQIIVQVELSKYQDSNGLSLPCNVLRVKDIPP